MRAARGWALSAVLAVVGGACSSSPPPDPPLALPDGCQPLLGGHDCTLPYPSDFFRTPDATTATGFRVETRGAAKLAIDTGASADVTEWRALDGFSRVPSIVAVLPGAVSTDGLVRYLDPADASRSAASPTVLLDAETGELVPHFADVDPRADDPMHRAIVLHPLGPLRPGARYVVALHGVRTDDGSLAPPGEGFRRLRDRTGASEPALAPLAARFEGDVFAPLAAAGLRRDELQLAWDFTTTTGERSTRDMRAVRDATLAWLAANEPAVTIDAVEDDPVSGGWRVVRGTVTGPSFVTTPDPGAELALDASGAVAQRGTVSFPFTAVVPAAVRDGFEPGRALSYGHGVFGRRSEIEGASAHTIANALHAVVFAIDWWGMTRDDLGVVLDALVAAPSRTLAFTDRVHQAMANWIVMNAAIATSLAKEPALHRPTAAGAPGVVTAPGGGTNAGALLYDPSAVRFLGISQGGILGGTLAALDPRLDRVVLNVGGGGLTHLMFRSNAFNAFLGFLGLHMTSALERQTFVATLQGGLDRIDPTTYAPLVVRAPLPGSPPDRHVLLQAGLGDAAVPNPASWLEANALGLGELAPNPLAVPGLAEVAPPQASALTVFDFGIDPAQNREAISFPDNPVHEGLRLLPSALAQMDRFFTDGTVVDTCGGVCRAP